jgi:CheY-like chemotaxis protein
VIRLFLRTASTSEMLASSPYEMAGRMDVSLIQVPYMAGDDRHGASRGRLLPRSPGVEQVFKAPSGPLALEVIEEFDPDVVFLDIRMPGMDAL